MNTTLLEIFNNTKDWLRFAEAKNAMLIAFNGASIYGIAQLPFFKDFQDVTFLKGYTIFVIILLIASTITSLISFVPKVTLPYLSVVRDDLEGNIFFFEYLRDTNPKKILELLKEKGAGENFTKVDEDLAQQIQSLAKVASRKYSLFTIAVWITASAYITLPIAGIFWLYNYYK